MDALSSTTTPQQIQALQRLKRSRAVALFLLLAMLVAFLSLHASGSDDFFVRLGIAASEAGVVGGLADWFAVTALFRHPLGLPIPHTAIVPANKARIAQGIGQFIDENFLDEKVVIAKVHDFGPAEWISSWLRQPENARWVAVRAIRAIPAILHTVEDQDLRRFVGGMLQRTKSSLDITHALTQAAELAIRNGQHQPFVEKLAIEARRYIDNHEARLEAAVHQHSSWWVPKTVDKRLARSVLDALRDLIAELQDPSSNASKRLEDSLLAVLDEKGPDGALPENLMRTIEGVMQQPGFTRWRAQMWEALTGYFDEQADSDDTDATLWLAEALRSFAETLHADAAMREKLDEFFEKLPGGLIEPLRSTVREFVTGVVRGWDSDSLIARLELTIGTDLQFLRVSGTLVAACAGTTLFLILEGIRRYS